MSEKRELPKGWVWRKIGEICEFANGLWAGEKMPLQKAKVIRNTNFAPGGKIAFETASEIEVEKRKLASRRLQNGDIVLENSGGGPAQPVGRVVFFDRDDGEIYSFGNFTSRIRADEKLAIPKLLFYALRNFYECGKTIPLENRTSGIRNLNRNAYKELSIPIPPLADQWRIVDMLDRQMTAVEKARNAAEEKLAAARLLPSALLRDALGNGKKRELPKGWVWAKIGEVCDLIFGQSPPSAHYKTIPEGLPFFQGKADFGGMHPTARIWCDKPLRRALPGDILISIRAPVGPTNVADVECCIGRGLAALRSKAEVLDKTFLLFYLKSAETEIAEKGSGSTFSAIGKDTLRSHPILLPPLAEQKRIAELLARQMAASEKARNAAESELREIRVLPAALLRQTLAGGL